MDSGYIELEGMDKFIEKVQNMSKESENAIKKALESTGDMFKADVVPKIRRSAVPRPPGGEKNTWRTGEHAADHVKRSKILGKDGNHYVLIGISKGDTSKWFYLKFIEYGTSKMPAQAPFGRTIASGRGKYGDKIIEVLKEELDL